MTSSNPAALLEQVTEALYARHTQDVQVAASARREYEQRRGRVHQDDELWEAWSASFVEWFVVERIEPDHGVSPAELSCGELAPDDPRAEVMRALAGSHRSLFEVRKLGRGKLELLDLLGGAVCHVDEKRAMHGVELGDIAELRLISVGGEVRLGRTLIYHPRGARAAIVERTRSLLAGGCNRLEVIDHLAHLRVQVARYRHMPPARVYELGSRIMG